MQIQILNVTIETKPTAKGSYQKADVAYKNLTFQGKVEGKGIMSFGATADSFKVLALAQPGEVYDVTAIKNDKGYLDWVKVTKAGAVDANQQPTAATGPGNQPQRAATAAPRSTYETPEERAIKQVYIVRQSNLNTASNLLSVGAKTPPTVEKVLEVAKQFEDYVFGRKPAGSSGFDDFPDVPDEFQQPKII